MTAIKRAAMLVLLLPVMLVASCGPVGGQEAPLSPVRAYELVAKVVRVEVLDSRNQVVAYASGFVVSPQQVVTNSHVVSSALKTRVIVNGATVRGTASFADSKTDLAIVRLAAPVAIDPCTLGRSSSLELGDPIWVLGRPFRNMDNAAVTRGVVSSLPIGLPLGWPKLIMTDAAINPGNSGGPVIDDQGRVVGMATAYVSQGERVGQLGYFTPVEEIARHIGN